MKKFRWCNAEDRDCVYNLKEDIITRKRFLARAEALVYKCNAWRRSGLASNNCPALKKYSLLLTELFNLGLPPPRYSEQALFYELCIIELAEGDANQFVLTYRIPSIPPVVVGSFSEIADRVAKLYTPQIMDDDHDKKDSAEL